MRKFALTLTAVLMAACGNGPDPVSPSDDTSMLMPDGGNPTPDVVSNDSSPQVMDSSTPVDAALPTDDQPAVTPDAGNEPDAGPTTEPSCWTQVCGVQEVYFMDGSHMTVTIRCDMRNGQVGLDPVYISCVANCASAHCTCDVEGMTGLSAYLENALVDGRCGDQTNVRYTLNGSPMTPTSGPSRLIRQ